MAGFEPKKPALLRILQILQEDTDADHPLTQAEIAEILNNRYGIVIERKAIGYNLSLLREAGYEIESGRAGSFLAEREFDDMELRVLIDAVLNSRHITESCSKDLINRLSNLSGKHFRPAVGHVRVTQKRFKTDNKQVCGKRREHSPTGHAVPGGRSDPVAEERAGAVLPNASRHLGNL